MFSLREYAPLLPDKTNPEVDVMVSGHSPCYEAQDTGIDYLADGTEHMDREQAEGAHYSRDIVYLADRAEKLVRALQRRREVKRICDDNPANKIIIQNGPFVPPNMEARLDCQSLLDGIQKIVYSLYMDLVREGEKQVAEDILKRNS